MHQSPADILQQYLQTHQITPQEFAHISGMPLTEVHGLLEGRLSFSMLRAHHLAAVFNTDTELWLYGQEGRRDKIKPKSRLHSLV